MTRTTKQKLDDLREIIKRGGPCIISFSGGVDSSFLLKVAHDTLAKGDTLAVIATSPSLAASELDDARSVAAIIGADLQVIESEEMKNSDYIDNSPDRCYHCKSELFNKLTAIADLRGEKVVYDGTNSDDTSDYRPGSRAAKELGVVSPLQLVGLTKSEIRSLSEAMELPTWNKPELACLASRIPHGSKISVEKLSLVDKAETFIRELGFRTVRVRHHGDIARIELAPEDRARAMQEDIATLINDHLISLGFCYVTLDLRGYSRYYA